MQSNAMQSNPIQCNEMQVVTDEMLQQCLQSLERDGFLRVIDGVRVQIVSSDALARGPSEVRASSNSFLFFPDAIESNPIQIQSNATGQRGSGCGASEEACCRQEAKPSAGGGRGGGRLRTHGGVTLNISSISIYACWPWGISVFLRFN